MSFRERLRSLLTVSDSPHRVAYAFSVGLFIGISPFLGAHVVLGLLLSWALRLDRLVVLTGVFVTNPWSIVPIYTFCTWVGTLVLGRPGIVDTVDWEAGTFMGLVRSLGDLLPSFVAGTLLVGAVVSVSGYFLIRCAVAKARGMLGPCGSGEDAP